MANATESLGVAPPRSLLWALGGEFPLLVEEAGVFDFAGEFVVGGDAGVDDGPVGELGGLLAIVAAGGGAVEGEAAAEDDVFAGIERVGEDEDGGAGGAVFFAAEFNAGGGPFHGEFVGDLFEDGVGGGVAP